MKRSFEDFQQISQVFFLAQILQSIFVIKFRFQKSENMKLGEIEKSILSIYDSDFLSHFKKPKYINIDDEISLIKDLSLTFLRRMVLFKSLCFDQPIQFNETSSFQSLCQYLKLPDFDFILSQLTDKKSFEFQYSSTWIDQLIASSKSNVWAINEILPRYSIPKPFHFVYLPYIVNEFQFF
jgi:hypothetical protein